MDIKILCKQQQQQQLDFVKFSVNLDLVELINKVDELPSPINKIILETINMLYPTDSWT